MKALLVLTEPPLPFGGAASRWNYVLIKELVRRGATVHVLCCSGGEPQDRAAAELFDSQVTIEFFPAVHRRGISRIKSWTQPVSHLFSEAMRRTLYALDPERFDIVQFETHFSGWLIDDPIDHATLNVHSLYAIDHRNDSGGMMSHLSAATLLRAEREVLRRFNRFSALTPRLAGRLEDMFPDADVSVCPMSIDLDLYEFRRTPRAMEDRPAIGIIGSFHWAPTQTAYRTLVSKIVPRVRSRWPKLRVVVVGRQANTFCQDLPDDPLVEIHSDVPDTKPFFHELDAMVYLPDVGSGMKVKVMESIAFGTPVVTNADGAEGLPDEIAETIMAASHDEAAGRVIDLLKDPVRADDEARRLRSVLADELSPQRCVDRTIDFACQLSPALTA